MNVLLIGYGAISREIIKHIGHCLIPPSRVLFEAAAHYSGLIRICAFKRWWCHCRVQIA